MKQNINFKIYRNTRIDLKDAIAKEFRFRAGLVKEMSIEIGKCVLDDFVA